MQLWIELKSPLCAGSGMGHAGYVDRDVVFDDAGLPCIPGRRLKGLLRDGYSQVLRTPLGADLPAIETIFGSIGGIKGALTVGDAQLPDAHELREWLLEVSRKLPHTLRRQDIIAVFTEVREQTSINRCTGAPDESTLRSTRLIRSGLKFTCVIQGAAAAHHEALRYASQAVQFMGTSRTRGLGWVRCTLSEDAPPDSNVPVQPETAPVWKSQQESLCFSIAFESAALFPNLAGDANTVLSHQCVPGSALLGLFAQRYLSRDGNKADDRFYELFCSGKLRFLSGNLQIEGENGRQRSTLLPHSIRTLKSDSRQFRNLVALERADVHIEPMRRAGGWVELDDLYRGRRAQRAEPATQLHYHHARASDPRFARALGEGAEAMGLDKDETGALFTYESLCADQKFLGEILGPPDLLAQVQTLIADGEVVHLGRSRSAQYGGSARWRWRHDAKFEAADRGTTGGDLLVTLLSPLLVMNRWGHPAPEFPMGELAEALGGVKLTLVQAFARTHWQGGYLSHQRLPRAQYPCLASGSVFVFTIELPSDGPNMAKRFSQASARSYGLRQEEGFGRLDVRWVSSISDRPELVAATKPEAMLQIKVPPPGTKWDLLRTVLRERLMIDAQVSASGKADQIKLAASVTPHLLQRLLALIDRTPVENIAGMLNENLADKARRSLKGCFFRDAGGESDMVEFLSRTWKEIWDELIGNYFRPQAGWLQLCDLSRLFAVSERNEDAAFAKELAKQYLRSFLTAVAWRKKTAENKQQRATRGQQ